MSGRPAGEAFDLKSDLRFGIPYSVEFQAELTRVLADLAFPRRAPLKGLISDLDDTLWPGLVGETGGEGVSWHLDHHSHTHAVYQQQLRPLGEMGVLLALASKNDEANAREGLSRDDLLIGPELFVPVEIHWGPKSESVTRILDAWNIGADSVLFIDDSRAELEEVRSVHPDILVRQFPTGDDASFELALELRDLFGKAEMTEADRLRRPASAAWRRFPTIPPGRIPRSSCAMPGRLPASTPTPGTIPGRSS